MDNVDVQKPRWKFFRSELCNMVWNPEKGCPLAEFKDGVFETEDKQVAKILRDKGYIEIPLDATQPPQIVKVQPAPVRSGDIPLGPAAAALKGEAAEAAIETQMAGAVDIPAPKETAVTVQDGPSPTPTRVKG